MSSRDVQALAAEQAQDAEPGIVAEESAEGREIIHINKSTRIDSFRQAYRAAYRSRMRRNQVLVERPPEVVARREAPVAPRRRSRPRPRASESTMPWRFTSICQVMSAPGNAPSTTSAHLVGRRVERADVVGGARQRSPRGAAASRSSAVDAVGHRHEGDPGVGPHEAGIRSRRCAAAWIISGA